MQLGDFNLLNRFCHYNNQKNFTFSVDSALRTEDFSLFSQFDHKAIAVRRFQRFQSI